MKRPPTAGERPWDCLKGTSVICAPIHYILAYVESLDYRGEWDDMFVKGTSLDETELVSVECSCVTLLCGWLRKSLAFSSANHKCAKFHCFFAFMFSRTFQFTFFALISYWLLGLFASAVIGLI